MYPNIVKMNLIIHDASPCSSMMTITIWLIITEKIHVAAALAKTRELKQNNKLNNELKFNLNNLYYKSVIPGHFCMSPIDFQRTRVRSRLKIC